MIKVNKLEEAKQQFEKIISEQLNRIKKIKENNNWVDFSKKETISIGICPGDGIGIEISKHAQRVLDVVLEKDISNKKIELKVIDGLTIENRVKHLAAIPADVLATIKSCDVILKGPTTTPQKGDGLPNIESANVMMRKELDLFACIRPVKVPEKNIDWIFFRENTEGAYVLGSQGIDIGDDLSIDFKVTTQQGCERIIRLAFEYARKNEKNRVTIITKSNVIKTTDGRFSEVAKKIAKEYEQFGITCDEWYIDIMTAKLLDPKRRHEFQVMVLPNLYGDILTDEAGQIQGGVGTAGSANIGKRYAMFEAIHGSAPRMVAEGREKYADPCSMIKAAALLLNHIGYHEQSEKIEKALIVATQYEKKLKITGHSTGATAQEFTDYILDLISNYNLESVY